MLGDLLEPATDEPETSDEQYRHDVNAATRLALLLVGALLFRLAFMVWGSLAPLEFLGGLSVLILFATGVFLLVLGTTGVDVREWGRHLSLGIIGAVGLSMAIGLTQDVWTSLGTDAMLFASESVSLVLSGENPYLHSMAGVVAAHQDEGMFATAQIDGTTVTSLSYPAGSFLVFLPAGVAGLQLRTISFLGALALGVLLVYDAPPELALGAVGSLMISRNALATTLGGLFDVLWILPLVVSMRFWYQRRWVPAAIAFGVAASIKQTPWAISPFLAIWIWHESPDLRVFARRAAACIVAGLGTFLAINLPWLLDAPVAWLQGVLTPVSPSAPLVHQGGGLAILTSLGLYPLTTGWHALAVAILTCWLLLTYFLYFNALRWAAWVFPVAIYFVHYRSLMSYFVAFVPIAFYALLCEFDKLPRLNSAIDTDDAETRVHSKVVADD